MQSKRKHSDSPHGMWHLNYLELFSSFLFERFFYLVENIRNICRNSVDLSRASEIPSGFLIPKDSCRKFIIWNRYKKYSFELHRIFWFPSKKKKKTTTKIVCTQLLKTEMKRMLWIFCVHEINTLKTTLNIQI